MNHDTIGVRNILAIYRGPAGLLVDPMTGLQWAKGEGHYITPSDAERLTEPGTYGSRWDFEEVPPELVAGMAPHQDESEKLEKPKTREARRTSKAKEPVAGDGGGTKNESE